MRIRAILLSIGLVVSGGTLSALTTDDFVNEQGVAGGFCLFAGSHAAGIFADTNAGPASSGRRGICEQTFSGCPV